MRCHVSSIDTKTRILDVAEGLFADDGFAATSLRDITTEAGVNLAAVNYHFGTKEALLSAVFDRRLGPINERRLEALEAVEARAKGGRPDLDGILRAFLLPPFAKMQEWGESGSKFIQLTGRTHSETNAQSHAAFLKPFEGVVERFGRALQRALPELGREELSWRLHFVIGAMAHTMAWAQKLDGPSKGRPRGTTPEAVQEALVEFAVAGMQAPVPTAQAKGAS